MLGKLLYGRFMAIWRYVASLDVDRSASVSASERASVARKARFSRRDQVLSTARPFAVEHYYETLQRSVETARSGRPAENHGRIWLY